MCIILTVSKEVIGNQYTIWQKHSCTNSPSDEISKNTTAGKKKCFYICRKCIDAKVTSYF